MILNEQQRQVGKDNFSGALKMTRRDLIPALVTVPSVTAFTGATAAYAAIPCARR